MLENTVSAVRWAVGGLICTALCAAALLLLSGCGGGFGADSGNASEIGPGIFEPDSTKSSGAI